MMKKIVLVVLMLSAMLMSAPGYADGITVQMKDATLNEIAAAIATKGNVAVIIDKNVDGNLKIPLVDFRNEPTERVLLKLTLVAGLAMAYTITPNSNFTFGFGIPTYFLTKLSIASRQQLSLQTSPPLFQYKYPLGSSVLLKNVSIAKVLLTIITSCNVSITSTLDVGQSEIIQQINITQMTPEVAFEALTKATGLMVIKIQKDQYLVTKGTAGTDKRLYRFLPSIPPNPRETPWPHFIEPLSSQ